MVVIKNSDYAHNVTLTPRDRDDIMFHGYTLDVSWTAGEVSLTNAQAKCIICDDFYWKKMNNGNQITGPCTDQLGDWKAYKLHSFPEVELDAEDVSNMMDKPLPEVHYLRSLGLLRPCEKRPGQKKIFKFHTSEVRRCILWLVSLPKVEL